VRALLALFNRELGLAWGGGGAPLLSAGFYLALVALVPLAAGPSPERLVAVAPGLAWLSLALAALLSLERLYERDLEDGGLDLLALGPAPLEATAAVKALAHWLATGAPLALLTPLAALALGAPPALAPVLLAAALLGGLCFTAVGGVGAALAAGSRRGGLLIAVLVLPLLVPPVIFGGGALQSAADGADAGSGLALLAAYSLLAAALSPFAAAAAIRNALS
jgi:heme exporter protein B